jgi:hypothetical protein
MRPSVSVLKPARALLFLLIATCSGANVSAQAEISYDWQTRSRR